MPDDNETLKLVTTLVVLSLYKVHAVSIYEVRRLRKKMIE